MKRRRFRPDLNGQGGALEPRRLLSGLSHAPAAQVSALAVIQVAGVRSGTYNARALPDVGTTTAFRVAGRIPSLGKYQLTGTLHGVGFILNGRPTGTATLTSAQGALNLGLVGPAETGSGTALPTHFDVNVTGGTGLFAGATGSGVADFRYRMIGKVGVGGTSRGKVVVVYTINLNSTTA